MKKLEDIPKKQVFEVPEGYFDRLPGVIQSRISQNSEHVWTPYVRFSLKYALPIMAIAVVGFFFWPKPGQSAEDLLASVDSASLVSFLEDSDISADDLLDVVPLHREEVDAIQENTIDEINLNDLDMDHLQDEFDNEF